PDLQFYCFLRCVTNLKKDQIMLLFDLLDRNGRGRVCSNGFYLVVCILLSHQFEATRFLSNIWKEEIGKKLKDFDISRDKVKTENLESKERPENALKIKINLWIHQLLLKLGFSC
ncbi:EF-hand calcium-binding domain-containing protein 9, partial [Phaenicophaeus curvirostris]|uniref:EF-hand calcium-binding domain-containing protein 9 n=1 Tax=Phaenicophaeus curvirostris TaxID=33595 RepID=UPI0037F0D04D